MLWLTNYEFGEFFLDIIVWVKFQSMDKFAQRVVMIKKNNQDELFRFGLDLDDEKKDLRDYLLKRKSLL